MKTLFIAPGSPWENGYSESFNSRLRDDVQRGDVTDGAGAIRGGHVVEEGKVRPLDDDLTLRMILGLERP